MPPLFAKLRVLVRGHLFDSNYGRVQTHTKKFLSGIISGELLMD
jgi:hypothetical protein